MDKRGEVGLGCIISSRRQEDKVLLEVESEYEEYLQLQGHLDDVHIITDKVATIRTNISQRGKNEATKYFLIPRDFRRGFQFNNSTSCQRIDLNDKVIFVYIIDKCKVVPTKKEIMLKKINERLMLKNDARFEEGGIHG